MHKYLPVRRSVHPFLWDSVPLCTFFLLMGGDADGEGVVLLDEDVAGFIFN